MTSARDGWSLIGICLGFFVVLLDATIVNVALGAIEASLGGGLGGQQWVVGSYTVAFGALLLSAGAAGDRWGSRRTYLLGLALLAGAGVACALAGDLSQLLLARVVQGAGAALVTQCSLALIRQRFPEERARARALGGWGGISGIGLAAGPVSAASWWTPLAGGRCSGPWCRSRCSPRHSWWPRRPRRPDAPRCVPISWDRPWLRPLWLR
jgi:DHA2 family methylenomycin A resistance protein-like MFS transporter